jgi:DNA invertase Pin-like site-specific DNA recombinase
MKGEVMIRATAYYRTSSATNVEGDSAHRQDAAVMRYAASNSIDVISCFWDAAVSGADELQEREGFAALLDHIGDADIGIVIVEDASRFARDLMVQEVGIKLLANRGVKLFTAHGDDLTDSSDPMRKTFRQFQGMMNELDKAMIVKRLKSGRERVKAQNGRCEGRKSYADTNPELIRQAKRLARKNPKTGKTRSLRAIASELAEIGFMSEKNTVLSPSVVNSLLK